MRIIKFFQSLRGKLILTYTAVTVLTLLALEITVLFCMQFISYGLNTETSSYLTDVVEVMAPQARSYLEAEQFDQSGLQSWLEATYKSGLASLPADSLFDSPAAQIVKTEPMYVLSADETVLAAAPYILTQGLVGRKYTPPSDVARSKEILANALKTDFSVADISAVQPDGSYLIAVPVQKEVRKGPIIGVIILTVSAPPSDSSHWWSVVLQVVPATGLMLLCLVVPFGALFGFIMSRGLTRRLKKLTEAADAWSEGDFSVQPEDRSKDEISYLGMRMRRMAESVQTLLQTRRELSQLEERNRLARELHDTVKQETFATLMQVRAAKNLIESDPAQAHEHLDEAEELIKSAQQELGQMISELRPTALEGQGLAHALSEFLAPWSQHSRIPSNIQVQNDQRLPLEIEQTLFRVAQEALANVARHSRASEVNVSLVFDKEQVTLSIRDNGVGFDPSAPSTGYGLESMRERLTALQGSLSIQSAPDRGTTVTATVLVPKQEQSQ